MRITVINGSPKGNELSVTIQHIKYLQQRFPEHTFTIHPVSQKIKKLENDSAYFDSIIESIEQSTIVIWAFPVYFYMVPGQLKRFIEMIFETKKEDVFKGKYATAVLTSGMIYDYHAHEYIQAISEDLGMNFVPGFSFNAVTEKDLLQPKYQQSYKNFFSNFMEKPANNIKITRQYRPIEYKEIKFNPGPVSSPVKKENDKKLLLLTDHLPETNLDHMVQTFITKTTSHVDVININDITIKSGCTGCVQCQFTGTCVIKDDVNDIFKRKILEADGTVFFATIKDRHVSSQWKKLFDRTLFISQRPVLKDKNSAFIVSGPLTQSKFTLDFINIYTACRFFNHVGSVSDDNKNTTELIDAITNLAKDMDFFIENKIAKPHSFYSHAYHFFTREMLYILSSVKTSTYKYFRKHKLLDFPHKNIRYVKQHHFYNFAFNFPGIKDVIRKKALNILIKPYGKLFSDKNSKDKE